MKQTSLIKQISVAGVASPFLLAAACGGGDLSEEREQYRPHESEVEADNTQIDTGTPESQPSLGTVPAELLASSTVSVEELRASLEQVLKEQGSPDEQAEPSVKEGSDGSVVRGKLNPELLRFLIATRERMEEAQ